MLVADERLVQEVIALLVAVAVEGLLLRLILNRRVQRVDDSRNERRVTSPMPRRMMSASGWDAEYSRTLRAMVEKQIALLEIVIIGVDLHYFLLLFRDAATNALNRG